MKTSRPLSLLLLALVPALAAGCSLGSDSAGEMGNDRFEYQSSACLFGCSLDQAALQGATVTVIAKDRDPEVRLRARVVDEAIGRITSQNEGCSCSGKSANGGSEGRSIEPAATCNAGETKECSLTVSIATSAAGETKIEVLDAQSAVRDRVALKVKPASHIDLSVRADDANVDLAGDAYPIRLGQKVQLKSVVKDDSGTELVFTKGGLTHEYGNTSVLQSDSRVAVGATDVEYIVTGRAGDTAVTVKAAGAQAVAKFHVTP